MKKLAKIQIILAISLTVLLLNNCGGVIGNIKIYEFPCNSLNLNKCLVKLIDQKLILKPDSSSIYKDDNTSNIFILPLVNTNDTTVYGYQIDDIANKPGCSMLTLIHYGRNGEILNLDKDLTSSEIKKCISDFEETILLKLKECLNVPK